MLKKILFISIFLLFSMVSVVAFEVPEGFEPALGIDGYTNNDDDDSGQVIDVYSKDDYMRLFEGNLDVDYFFDYNGDGTFNFNIVDIQMNIQE